VVYQNKVLAPKKKVKYIKVPDTRKALAILASEYYGNLHKKMRLIGITGTNGKTTTCELTYQLLRKLNKKVGLISTISAKSSSGEFDTGYHVTTPDALNLHKIISIMHKEGCEFLIIETTSHGLHQHRTYGLKFEVSAITNITPEHLDYHKSFNDYLRAKLMLASQSKHLILNKYDPSLKTILKKLPKNTKYKIVDYEKMQFPESYKNKFPGDYNLENAIISYSLIKELLGHADQKLFENLKSVKGRMEKISNKKDITIIIDFAHDAVSLENALRETRKITKRKLILVFGCAGLRDKHKRPKMGKIGVELADKVVVTAEDPRTEKLEDINSQIEKGIKKAGGIPGDDYLIIKDRQKAIYHAINKLAKPGDTVLITGKGHERSMCFGTIEYPWSDHKAVKTAINKKAAAQK
jgi:UDP-N-acetylmuramoyl-L-alanyl-D-glutamate--2,6-diaminopimelate ligase